MVYPEMLELRDRIIASGAFSKEEIAIGDNFDYPATQENFCVIRAGDADFAKDKNACTAIIQVGVALRDDNKQLDELCFNRLQMILRFSSSINNIRPLVVDYGKDAFRDFKEDFVRTFPFCGFRLDFEVFTSWPRKLTDI